MNPSRSIYILLILIVFDLSLSGCDDGYLRGSVSPSHDGKTYLSIVDDNGGKCGSILVDGEIWDHGLNTAIEVSPGLHTIECGSVIEFIIPDSVVFEFDYWGP